MLHRSEVSFQRFDSENLSEGWTLAYLEFALYELRAEGSDPLSGDGVTLGLVLGHLVLQGNQADGGTLLFLQAEELKDALVVLHVTVDEYEEDLERRDEQIERVNPLDPAGAFTVHLPAP